MPEIQTVIIRSLPQAEFARICGIPKYTITRHEDQFIWDQETTGPNRLILLTDENKAKAQELNESRKRRFRKSKVD